MSHVFFCHWFFIKTIPLLLLVETGVDFMVNPSINTLSVACFLLSLVLYKNYSIINIVID